MTYALRCKAVSPSELTDPRTCSLRSERIHRANLSVFGLINVRQSTYALSDTGRLVRRNSCHTDFRTARPRRTRELVGLAVRRGLRV
jgi:hypothetical protein